MGTLEDVETCVEQHKDICHLGTPASQELIERAERALGVRFASDYRAFLMRWGTLAIGSLEYYEITADDFEASAVPNAIWYTQILRQEVGLPRQFVILFDNNGDEYFCLDTSDDKGSRVVIWDVREWDGDAASEHM